MSSGRSTEGFAGVDESVRKSNAALTNAAFWAAGFPALRLKIKEHPEVRKAWGQSIKEIEEKYPALLFWRFHIKWIYVKILEYNIMYNIFYTQINHNPMQRELFNNIFD